MTVVVAVLQYASPQERRDIENGVYRIRQTYNAKEVNNAYLDTSPLIFDDDIVFVVSHGSNFVKIGHYIEPMFKNAKGRFLVFVACELLGRSMDKDVIMHSAEEMGGSDENDSIAQLVANASKKPVVACKNNVYLRDVFEQKFVQWLNKLRIKINDENSYKNWAIIFPQGQVPMNIDIGIPGE